MANINLVVVAVSAIVEAGNAKIKEQSAGAKVAKAIREVYVDVNGSDSDFIAAFGNAKPPKAKDFVAGSIADGVNKAIARLTPAKREEIKKTLKVRLSEARALRKLGGMPAKDENIQAALKRYKPNNRAAKPEGNDTGEHFSIPAEVTVNELAEAFSVWMKDQNAAKVAAVAKQLGSMLQPAAKTRNKKAA